MMEYFGYKSIKIFIFVLGICFVGNLVEAQELSSLHKDAAYTYQQDEFVIDKGVDLKEGLEQLEEHANVVFLFRSDVVKGKKVSKKMKLPDNVSKALEKLLKDQDLIFKYINPKTYGIYAPEEIVEKEEVPLMQQVSGTVTDANTGESMPGVNILVKGTNTGTSTDAEGGFELTVESLQDTLVFTFIGYQRQEVPINGRTNIDVALNAETSTLDEVVVTGAGVVSEKKRLGQSIGTVGAEDIEKQQVGSISDALQGRIPGLVANSLGEVGSSSPIRVRGTVSLTQRNGPLIYIDGVRVNNERRTFASIETSVLSQINPDNIERIEVLKGAAAATLYGTEASSGVIQVFTKKGRDMPTQWTVKTKHGISQTPLDRIPKNVVYDSESDQLVSNFPAEQYIDPGYQQSHNLSVRGGTETFGYFVSGSYRDINGSLPTNSENNLNGQVNLTMRPVDDMEIQLGLDVIDNQIRAPYPSWGLMGEFVLADPSSAGGGRPYGELYHSIPGVLAYDNRQTENRSTIDAKINYQFSETLSAHILVGNNKVNQRSVIYVPPGIDMRDSDGLRSVTNTQHSETSVEASAAWDIQPWSYLASTLTVGGQAFWQKERYNIGAVRDYSGGAIETLRGGSTITDLDEAFEEVISAGVFAQEQIALKDRLFFTAGLRIDGNSTFGNDFGFQPYPQFGMSWVISDEPFWNFDLFDRLRFRGAYGTSGLQPGVYDALRTWQVTSMLEDLPVVLPNSYGNENLKPERSREIEIGTEIGLMDSRFTMDVTYYWQQTDDAILERLLAPSSGFLNPQLVNIGELQSQGLEVTGEWMAVDTPNLGLEMFGTLSMQKQTVTDLGGVPGFRTGTDSRQWNFIEEGYQPGAIIGPVTVPGDPYELSVPISEFTNLDQLVPNYLLNEDGERARRFLGNQLPTTMGSFGFTLDLPEYNLSFSTLLRAEAGFVMHNETRQVRVGNEITPMTARMNRDLSDPNTSTERRREIADTYVKNHPDLVQSWISDGDYLRLQVVSVNWSVPSDITSVLRAEDAMITLSGRNLLLITGYEGIMDPGTTSTGADFASNIDYFGAPNPRSVEMSLRITF